MAADPGSRKRLRRDSMDGSLRGTPSTSKDRRTKRPVKPIKERWLLTRKTWRYMADAGRRLIPEGTHNHPEDLPRIEQTFQEVCQKEPRFLLWRKSSYPGSLTFRAHRRRRQIGKDGSYRARCQASSADEADDVRNSPQSFNVHVTTAGKFDLTKAKREPLLFSGGSGSGSTPSSPEACRKISQENVEEDDLVHMLQTYLFVGNSSDELAVRSNLPSEQPVERPKTIQTGSSLDHRSLVNKLQRYVDKLVDEAKESSSGQSCTGEKGRAALSSSSHSHVVRQQLVETLNRYYGKFSSRDHVISDILTDRKLLEKLYFDLRYSRKFRMPRCASSWWLDTGSRESAKKEVDLSSFVYQLPENYSCQIGVQTNPVSRDALDACLLEKEKEQSSRRRSSVDDVSPSVGDTIKRYLRMARKKSIDADKDDRFKRVNYDRLLLAKRKGAELKVSDDSGNSKGCQTEDDWAVHYREMFFPTSECPSENLSDIDVTTSPPSRNASSRSSIDAGSEEVFVHVKYPHQSFLSHLLHVSNAHKDKPHSAPGSPALTSSTANSTGGTAMQKSKSSSSVVHHGSRLVAKKIWRSRSKSISRTSHQPFVWTPQGKCTWAGTGGRRVTLQDVSLRSLSEIERKVLCKVAVAKLQALNLGVHIRPPNESLGSGLVTTKPKKRAYLLKRKALTTSFFDNKEKDAPVGLVFGIPLSQCLENDRIARIAAGEVTDVSTLSKSSRHGSRTSFSSLTETSVTTAKTEEKGSNESLSSKGTPTLGGDSGMVELSDSGGSTGSEWDTVPNIVRQCIWHLENTGFQTLGVFRVSSSKKRVRELRENFDCGRETKIGLDQCPHDVATLLKEYFRDLPDPLLCRELYQAFVHTQKIRNRRLQQEALQHLIQLLPTANRDTLWTLLTFLNDVAKYSQDYKTEDGEWLPGNKMDKTNLATVFAPNILHCVKPGQVKSEISSERAEERMDVINVMRTLLEHTSSLFTVPAALLDEVYQHMMDTHPAELDIALSRRIEDQSEDEVDLCSEAETVEETLTMSSTVATKETSTRKMWTREQCLHQAAGIGGDIGPKPRRSKRLGGRRKEDGRSDSVDSGSSEDPSDTRRRSSSTVITASLTIPMSDAFSLSLDIPYIEETPKQSSVILKQRQRSISGYREAGRHGSDSNISSLATQSSDQPPSSPPSWTSSSPTSPDSSGNAISHIPDQQAILQKVSFTISSEVKQVNRSDNQREARKSTPYTPSITNIGGAVMRSKTADIERMLKISGSTVEPVTQQTIRNPSTTLSDSKKYTKRRYTDSRHPTRHIPDSNSLTDKIVSAPSTTPSPSTTTQNQRVPAQSVWKRRELISSTPDDK